MNIVHGLFASSFGLVAVAGLMGITTAGSEAVRTTAVPETLCGHVTATASRLTELPEAISQWIGVGAASDEDVQTSELATLAVTDAVPMGGTRVYSVRTGNGSGGAPFTLLQPWASWAPSSNGQGTPAIIEVRHGNRVDALRIGYRGFNGNGIHFTHRAGGSGGTASDFGLDRGEYIVRIRGRAGRTLDSIQFMTNRGRWSPVYGGSGGSQFDIQAPGGYYFEGFTGNAGRVVDHIRVIWRRAS